MKVKIWETTHRGSTIRVESSLRGEKLFVNGQLQDAQIGALSGRSRLWGRLPDGAPVKVSLGIRWTVRCMIFVEDQLVLEG